MSRCALRWILLCGLASPALAVAADGVHWRTHIAARASPEDGRLGPVPVDERERAKVSRDVDYVSVSLEALFLRNLPGFEEGGAVLLGVELEGVLADGKPLRTVAEVTRCTTSDCFLYFDRLPLIAPFVYGGRDVVLTLHLRSVEADEAEVAKGRLAGLGELVGKLDPHAREAIASVGQAFVSLLGAAGRPRPTWTYRVRLAPADTALDAEPERLFTATRHVFIAAPPADAPSRFLAIKPREWLPRLQYRGNRLQRRADEGEYVETPYLVLSVQRYRRYPTPATPAKRLTAELDRAYHLEAYARCGELLRALPAALAAEPITAGERHLLRSQLDVFGARLAAARARKAGDAKAERQGLVEEGFALARIAERFQDLLEETERREHRFRVLQLQDRLRALGAEALPEALRAALGGSAAFDAVNPSAPLKVQLWSERPRYRRGEKIKVYVRGNRPFFARAVYRDASGKLLQILPNPYRRHHYFQGGAIYEIPAADDRFDLEVSPPYGAETILLYASTLPLGDLQLEPQGELYAVKTPEAELGVRSRGVTIKRREGTRGIDASRVVGAAPADAPSFFETSVRIETRER